MALKYQFNKIAMQNFNKQLKIRRAALPTLKSKEAFLRVTIKKQKEDLQKIIDSYQKRMDEIETFIRLWAEFPEDIFFMREVLMSVKKIAGIKAPNLEKIDYDIMEFSNFNNPAWLQSGVNILKEITILLSQIEITKKDHCFRICQKKDYPKGKSLRKGADTSICGGDTEDKEIPRGC